MCYGWNLQLMSPRLIQCVVAYDSMISISIKLTVQRSTLLLQGVSLMPFFVFDVGFWAV